MRLINVDTQVPLLRAPLRYEVKKLSREITLDRNYYYYIWLLFPSPRGNCKAIVGQWYSLLETHVDIYRVARFVTYSGTGYYMIRRYLGYTNSTAINHGSFVDL